METNPFDAFRDAEVMEIIESDDKERFLTLLSAHAHTVEKMDVVMMCASREYYFKESTPSKWDESSPFNKIYLTYTRQSRRFIPLRGSINKPSLTCARLLAPHTDGLNNIAWSYVQQGKLASLAALLLVAQEKALVPFGSGSTIRQRVMGMVQKLTPEDDLDYEGAIYRSMLIEACKLFDIFERAGGALSLYCSSMHEYVPPHKVLSDVASLLKKAGHALEPRDVDLRDCYRDCAEFKNASVFKLSDPESPEKKYCLPSSLTRAQDFGATRHSYPYPGTCQLFHKLKLGQVLSMKNLSASEPRLLRTAAGQVDNGGSGIPRKHLAYIAFRLKRGIKF